MHQSLVFVGTLAVTDSHGTSLTCTTSINGLLDTYDHVSFMAPVGESDARAFLMIDSHGFNTHQIIH